MSDAISTYLSSNGPFAFGMLLLIGVVIWQARELSNERTYSRELQEKRLTEARIVTDLVNKFTDTVETVMSLVRGKLS